MLHTDCWSAAGIPGWDEETTSLHDERLDAVMQHLLRSRAETVIDLGCGAGSLLKRLVAEPQLRRIVGLDSSAHALSVAEHQLTSDTGAMDRRLTLRHGSVTDVFRDVEKFEAAIMVEVIEHTDPTQLGRLERGLFVQLRPRLVIVTTPNRDYNALYGLAEDELRHPHHRFEWGRRKFEHWATGVGRRNRYSLTFEGVGPANAWFGCSTQMAVFSASCVGR